MKCLIACFVAGVFALIIHSILKFVESPPLLMLVPPVAIGLFVGTLMAE